MRLSYSKILGFMSAKPFTARLCPPPDTPNFASVVLNSRLRPVVLNAGKLHRAGREATSGKPGRLRRTSRNKLAVRYADWMCKFVPGQAFRPFAIHSLQILAEPA